MERSFANEIDRLKLGDGDVFHGEGILAEDECQLERLRRVKPIRAKPLAAAMADASHASLDTLLRGEDMPAGVPVPYTHPVRALANVH